MGVYKPGTQVSVNFERKWYSGVVITPPEFDKQFYKNYVFVEVKEIPIDFIRIAPHEIKRCIKTKSP